jgi:hypothetical protein
VTLVSAAAGSARLEQLVTGLLFVSEADSPLTVVQFGPQPDFRELDLRRALHEPDSSPITRHSLDALFARTVSAQAWHGPAERAIVERYRALLDFLNSALSAARVFRVGTIEVKAYALGKTCDERWLGVNTTLIET